MSRAQPILVRDLKQMGFRAPWELASRKRLMIGTEGVSDTGKTEFILSCPPPIGIVCIDRNYEMTFNNPHPPPARANLQKDVYVKIIDVPAGNENQATQEEFAEYWRNYRDTAYMLSGVQDLMTLALDSDSDSWPVQRLAAYGKLKGVAQMSYDTVYSARRAFIAKIHDSGKNIVATNKLKKEWVTQKDQNGNAILDDSGKPKKEESGKLERQGYPDQDYLYHVQLRHLYKRTEDKVIKVGPKAGQVIPGKIEYGIRILKCKPRMELMTEELWGASCNFKGLVKLIFPNDSMKLWGYPTEE